MILSYVLNHPTLSDDHNQTPRGLTGSIRPGTANCC
jgi:hypothetical protein